MDLFGLPFCAQVAWTYMISILCSGHMSLLYITMLPSAISTYHSFPQYTHVPFYNLWHYKDKYKKKDGDLHFCIDFCKLNARMKKDFYLLPHTQEAIESLIGAGYFSWLDLKKGVWQITMDKALEQYTAFIVGNLGFFKCECMPFGLCNTPATFQRLMQNCLGELNLTYCLIDLDDVIVFSKTEEEHLWPLHFVFECIWEHNLKLKLSKCEFPLQGRSII